MTIPLTRYEIARLVGTRAAHLNQGATPTVDVTGMIDALEIAEKELRMGTIPIDVIRTLPDGQKVQLTIKPKVQVDFSSLNRHLSLSRENKTESGRKTESKEKTRKLQDLKKKSKMDLTDSSSEDESSSEEDEKDREPVKKAVSLGRRPLSKKKVEIKMKSEEEDEQPTKAAKKSAKKITFESDSESDLESKKVSKITPKNAKARKVKKDVSSDSE